MLSTTFFRLQREFYPFALNPPIRVRTYVIEYTWIKEISAIFEIFQFIVNFWSKPFSLFKLASMFVKFYLWFANGLHLFNKNAITVNFQRWGILSRGILSQILHSDVLYMWNGLLLCCLGAIRDSIEKNGTDETVNIYHYIFQTYIISIPKYGCKQHLVRFTYIQIPKFNF